MNASAQAAHAIEKARRVDPAGERVRLLDADVYEVQGDGGTYFVIVRPAEATCTCPASGPCWHMADVVMAREAARHG